MQISSVFNCVVFVSYRTTMFLLDVSTWRRARRLRQTLWKDSDPVILFLSIRRSHSFATINFSCVFALDTHFRPRAVSDDGKSAACGLCGGRKIWAIKIFFMPEWWTLWRKWKNHLEAPEWHCLTLINLKEMMVEEVITAAPPLPPSGSLSSIDKPLLLLILSRKAGNVTV